MKPTDLQAWEDGVFFVGIDRSQPSFRQGVVDPRVLIRLHQLAKSSQEVAFGIDYCHICNEMLPMITISVCTDAGLLYRADYSLIHHIEAHDYQPPEVFIAAILDIPEWNDELVPIEVAATSFRGVRDYNLMVLRAHLTPRYVAARFKIPTIGDDPRWNEAEADRLYSELFEESIFKWHEKPGLLDLLKDPQFDRLITMPMLPDLTPFPTSGDLAIGYYGADTPLPTGEVAQDLLAALRKEITMPLHCGQHRCPQCDHTIPMTEYRMSHGSRVYRFSNMLFHLIEVHGYCPPPEFLRDLRAWVDAKQRWRASF